jgi:hypothetical protein
LSRTRRQHIETLPAKTGPVSTAYTTIAVAIPDWPPSLRTPVTETGPALTLEQVRAALPKEMPPHALVHFPEPTGTTGTAPILAFFFGTTKDGRHLAAEVRVDGRKVVNLVPLCASRYPQESAKAWEMCAFARLCHGREYTATERAANLQQSKSVRLEDVADGQAVALSVRKGQTVALAMEIEGSTVLEPKVVGTGNRLFAWQEAHAYAQRWFLPRRRAK